MISLQLWRSPTFTKVQTICGLFPGGLQKMPQLRQIWNIINPDPFVWWYPKTMCFFLTCPRDKFNLLIIYLIIHLIEIATSVQLFFFKLSQWSSAPNDGADRYLNCPKKQLLLNCGHEASPANILFATVLPKAQA